MCPPRPCLAPRLLQRGMTPVHQRVAPAALLDVLLALRQVALLEVRLLAHPSGGRSTVHPGGCPATQPGVAAGSGRGPVPPEPPSSRAIAFAARLASLPM